MPIYEYRCSSCGAEHEALQKITDPLLTTCPACHRETLVKQVSAAGFQLKGSGWYVTDFRNGGKPATPAPAKKEPSADGAKADGGDAKKDTAASSASSESSAAPATPAPAKPASSE